MFTAYMKPWKDCRKEDALRILTACYGAEWVERARVLYQRDPITRPITWTKWLAHLSFGGKIAPKSKNSLDQKELF